MQILSQRFFGPSIPWQSVFEWEDVISNQTGIPIVSDAWGGPWLSALKRKFPMAGRMVKTRKPSFQFTMSAHLAGEECLPNIVPCIIDFLIRDERRLKWFERLFSRNPLVMISSREAYEFLLEKNVRLNLRHWPLSVSDRLRIDRTQVFEKKYDIAMVTRGNPVLSGFLRRYRESHPDLKMFDGCQRVGREEYLQLLRETRIMLYCTPGMDGARADANGFNHVTPRFLEMLCCGCHVLARYPKNADTDYYELSTMAPNIVDYDQFDAEMNRARSCPVDMEKYSRYLDKHYTSTRVPMFRQYIEESGLS